MRFLPWLEFGFSSLTHYRTHLTSRDKPDVTKAQMAYTSNLSDAEWKNIEPILPKRKRTRPAKWSQREILDGILYQLKNGCNWVDLPKDFPPYSTVFWHFKRWRENEGFAKMLTQLHGQVRVVAKKKLNIVH
jgi:transposase